MTSIPMEHWQTRLRSPSTQGGYNEQRTVGDLRRQMAGISNICHLRHDLRQCDRAIKSFG